MPELLPTPFLFRFTFPVRHIPGLPRAGSPLLGLSEGCEFPRVADLDTPSSSKSFHMRGAWNEDGLGFSLHVRGKSKPVQGAIANPTWADGLQLWIDTRNTQSVHRATRFCHHFCLLATGGGQFGNDPEAVQLPIPRAREESPLCNPDDIRLRVRQVKGGYDLEAWLPSRVLNGFAPEESPRLGWYYRIRDAECGDQFLSVSPEFPFATDPSLWSTLELVRE